VVLWASSNIPDITEKIQTLIMGQVQDLLSGIEKAVMVNVHVIKIAHKSTEKIKGQKQEIPFLR